MGLPGLYIFRIMAKLQENRAGCAASTGRYIDCFRAVPELSWKMAWRQGSREIFCMHCGPAGDGGRGGLVIGTHGDAVQAVSMVTVVRMFIRHPVEMVKLGILPQILNCTDQMLHG